MQKLLEENRPPAPPRPIYQPPPRVIVADFEMNFGSMIWFMIKWAFASIPAMIVIGGVAFVFIVIGSIALAALGGLAR
jgi:hypothetical protein